MSEYMLAIHIATTAYQNAMVELERLQVARRAGQPVDATHEWLYTQMAQEAAATLATAWAKEAALLLTRAIDALPE